MRIETAAVIFCFVYPFAARCQGTSKVLTVDDPRPLAAACDEFERLSVTSVNYEDGRYVNLGDLKDVTGSALTPQQRGAAGPGFHLLVPRGGTLSATVSVDAVTGRLESVDATKSAALGFVASHKLAFGQTFAVEADGGDLFILPDILKDANGAAVAVDPVLSSHIAFPEATRTGYETIRVILQQISRATGARVDFGTIPIGAFARSLVTIGANGEEARTILLKVFRMMGAGTGVLGPVTPSPLSYRLFYDRIWTVTRSISI